MERKNLHTLTISISTIEDMKILTQLTFLIHLNIIFNSSGLSDDNESVDKNTILPIVNQLQHFPHLESFVLTVVNSWSKSDFQIDKQMILSKIFDISPARDIRLARCGAITLPQFNNDSIIFPTSWYNTISCTLAPPQLNKIFNEYSFSHIAYIIEEYNQ